jgi:hypothetical protein
MGGTVLVNQGLRPNFEVNPVYGSMSSLAANKTILIDTVGDLRLDNILWTWPSPTTAAPAARPADTPRRRPSRRSRLQLGLAPDFKFELLSLHWPLLPWMPPLSGGRIHPDELPLAKQREIQAQLDSFELVTWRDVEEGRRHED